MKNKRIISVVALLCVINLAGCGIPKMGNHTKTAVEYIQNLEYDKALESLDMATEAGENAKAVRRIQGIALLNRAEYAEALECFTEALSYSDGFVNSMDIDLNFYIADCYEHMNSYQEAIDTYSAILSIEKKNYHAYYKSGCCYLAMNKHDEAVGSFDKALTLNPDDYDLRIRIAGQLFDYDMTEQGQGLLNDFLVEKENKMSDFDKGRIYFYMKDYDSAKQYFEEARDDNDQDTILYLGKTYELLGDYNYAESTYRNYLSSHPDSAVIYNQLGLSMIKAGDFAGARDAFLSGRQIENNGIDQTLFFNEIMSYEYLGDFQQASVKMAEYLKKYPDDTVAARENEFLKSR